MGRPVIKYDRQWDNGADAYLAPFVPRSTTLWKSTMVSAWRDFYGNGAGASRLGEATLQVDQTDVCTFRLAETYTDNAATCIVIPWGDGLRFSGSQSVRWSIAMSIQSFFSATFFGEED